MFIRFWATEPLFISNWRGLIVYFNDSLCYTLLDGSVKVFYLFPQSRNGWFQHLLLLCLRRFIWKVWLSGGEVSLIFQTGSVEWKCCEWQRSVSLTQSRHASPSHRLAQKLRVTVPRKTKGRGRQKSVRHSAFCWTIDVRHDSRACVRVCVRSVASSKLSHFLYLFCGSIQLACCLLSSPHWFFLYKFRMLHVCKLTKMFLFAFIQVE